MQPEPSETYGRSYRLPLYNLRWSAVLAGLVVSVVSYVLLLVLGGAVVLGFFNAGAKTTREILAFAINSWNAFSMVAASVAGGFMAARASGMRRTPDGVLHGVLAWGVAMLVTLAIAASAGLALGELFGGANRSMMPESMLPLDGDERMALADILESRLGLTTEQAESIVDQIVALSAHGAAPDAASVRHAVRTASSISGWLSSAILFSLVGAVGGGVLGSRSSRRKAERKHPHGAPPQADAPPAAPPYEA